MTEETTMDGMTDGQAVGIGVVFLVFFAWLVFMVARGTYVDAQCLRLGYRDASVTWTGAAYCVKRQDQTDVVVPLDSARALRR